MISVIIWAILFSIMTTMSILLLGHRDLIAGDIGFTRLIRIIFDWRFILGALLAFGARLLFIMTNNAIYKIPELASSSTTITTLINSAAVIMVVIANYYFLDEHLSAVQFLGAGFIIIGIFFMTKT
jgi:drug/metabolite transporter (DMT)-like permease